MNIFPYRVRFTKTGKMRFLSHHDLMRLFERALRRSGLPLRMTEGYNPHPILSFPTALGLGIESLDEILEVELTAWTPPAKIEQALAVQLPEGVKLSKVEAFARKDRSAIDYVEYEATVPKEADLVAGVREFLAKKEAWIERKSDKGGKKVEIRRYVLALEAEPGKVLMRVRVTDQGTAKPEEVLRSIGLEPGPEVRIRKTYTEVGTR
ncbi:MAG TPA: TIGR03936 family radical SAM-associated protein [Planctomycetota bacterium]|jgi:radical SAM-linked protein|nr:TIGR03936 family radical SAM-associated protein [Planctomycetota bacterium]